MLHLLRQLHAYGWGILKNLLGWSLIIAALLLGPLPGPGGIPIFLIGFALVTFPGKRRLTARILRGIPLRPGRWFVLSVAVLSLILPPLVFGVATLVPASHAWLARQQPISKTVYLSAGVAAPALLLVLFLLLPRMINILIRTAPRVRGMVRPFLRRWGIRLTPPRLKRRMTPTHRM
jgi:hypothetical protein